MKQRKSERGVALVYIAVFMVVILGFTVVGIDVARLAHVATEVQSVADVAARAGTKKLLDVGGTPNAGITEAKNVAHQNMMNGSVVPIADVAVDEGNYDFEGERFECCTSNTPCCANGSWGGTTCVASNSCARRTAVLAMPHTTVDNLFAGVFNYVQGGRIANAAVSSTNQTSRVEKLAIAAASGPGSGCQVPEGCTADNWACYCDHGVAPCIPIAVPSCEFNPPSCNGVGCSLPTLQVSANGSDTAAWTGFDAGANDSNVRAYMNQGPCNPPGASDHIDQQTVGGSISLNNGLNSNAPKNVFGLMNCLANCSGPTGTCPSTSAQSQGCAVDASGNIIPGQRGNVFTIPVIESNDSCTANFVQSQPMVGFATVQVTNVGLSVTPRTVTVKVIRNQTATNTQGGGLCVGTDCRVTMTQ